MMQQDIAGLLSSHTYRNNRGSIFNFQNGQIIKNGAVFGDYQVEHHGEQQFLSITKNDIGTVVFQLGTRLQGDTPLVVHLYRKEGEAPCMSLQVDIGPTSTHGGRSTLKKVLAH